MAANGEISGNTAARGPVTKQVLGVDRSCDRASLRGENNRIIPEKKDRGHCGEPGRADGAPGLAARPERLAAWQDG
jgi:hypothetical protein